MQGVLMCPVIFKTIIMPVEEVSKIKNRHPSKLKFRFYDERQSPGWSTEEYITWLEVELQHYQEQFRKACKALETINDINVKLYNNPRKTR